MIILGLPWDDWLFYLPETVGPELIYPGLISCFTGLACCAASSALSRPVHVDYEDGVQVD